MKLALCLLSLMCYDKSGPFLLVATSGACLDRVSCKSNLLLRSGVWQFVVTKQSAPLLERKFPGDRKKRNSVEPVVGVSNPGSLVCLCWENQWEHLVVGVRNALFEPQPAAFSWECLTLAQTHHCSKTIRGASHPKLHRIKGIYYTAYFTKENLNCRVSSLVQKHQNKQKHKKQTTLHAELQFY